MATKTRSQLRVIRHTRVRKTVSGAAERPRLAVFRSLKHISCQVIDDSTGRTLVAASSMEKDLKATGNVEGATLVGQAIAKRAAEAGIKAVVFDRGGFRYHGRVSALAEGARKGGLEF
ncbi:MAG: 50S ribosomal protein L18 [Chthonomonas sp.]|nr:50S ribosomal protein L18 [Chthonomonas sp.]